MSTKTIQTPEQMPASATEAIPAISAPSLHEVMKFPEICDYRPSTTNLCDLKMDQDDIQVIRYLIRNARPKRHLEFGTWEGAGALAVLEECEADVWSINLWDGETADDNQPVYGEVISLDKFIRRARDISRPEALKDLSVENITYSGEGDENSLYSYTVELRTDKRGLIGHLVQKAGLGHRFCQIYSDSRKWDISRYPRNWFDSVLIDGSHDMDTVINDTYKALALLRPGGIIMWHDFCPVSEVYEAMPSCRGVMAAINILHEDLKTQLSQLFWVEQTWMLVGVVNEKK